MNVLPCKFNSEGNAALLATRLYAAADVNAVGVHLRTEAGAVAVVGIDLTANIDAASVARIDLTADLWPEVDTRYT